MARIMVLQEDSRIEEKRETGTYKLFWKSSPTKYYFYSYEIVFEFNLQYPDGREENIEYGRFSLESEKIRPRIEGHPPEYIYGSLPSIYSFDTNRTIRIKALQKLINRLENEGYKISHEQLALFMSGKIPRLIITSAKDM